MKHHIPNALTLFRIVAIAPIGLLMFCPEARSAIIVLTLFVLAAISDFFDGYLARRWAVSSSFGRIFDPIADKLMVATVLVCEVAKGTLYGWTLIPVIAIILRELAVSGLREHLATTNIILPVSTLAKWKTTAQLMAISLLLLIPLLPVVMISALVLLWAAALLTLWTGGVYLKAL